MSEEDRPWDYTRMRVMAAEMVAAIHRKRSVLNAPEATAVFERLVAGEDVPIDEIGRAYTVLEIAAEAVHAAQGRRP